MEYTNEELDNILDNHPLLLEGYDPLECPDCGKLCFPKTKFSNGTIRYDQHKCKGTFDYLPKVRSFSILENGELKEK